MSSDVKQKLSSSSCWQWGVIDWIIRWLDSPTTYHQPQRQQLNSSHPIFSDRFSLIFRRKLLTLLIYVNVVYIRLVFAVVFTRKVCDFELVQTRDSHGDNCCHHPHPSPPYMSPSLPYLSPSPSHFSPSPRVSKNTNREPRSTVIERKLAEWSKMEHLLICGNSASPQT